MTDIVISMTPPQITRATSALGKQRKLTDAEGNPRAATPAELKHFFIEQVRGMTHGIERTEARMAAEAALVVQPFDPQ